MEAVGIHEVVDELIRAIGDAVAEDGGKALQQADVVILVEEGGLNEDGGHGRTAQDDEVGAQFDAAVRKGLVDAADIAVQGILHIMGEEIAPRRAVIAVGLTAAAAAGIGMDGDKEVGRPVVGHARDIREFRRFAAQIVALQHGDVEAVMFERDGAVFGDQGVDVGFRDAVVIVDGTGVRNAAEGVAWIQQNVHKKSPFI